MSKFGDLRYYAQNLYSDIEDIEDDDLRDKITKSFSKVESLIDDIESELSNIQYSLDELV